METIIEVEDLVKRYGEITAVDRISFEVHEGEIFGMVGPNGAGKTTTIECIEGLRVPDDGTIRVWGLNPQQDGYRLRERIGVQLQESALPDRIKVWEALDLFSSFYTKSVDWRPLLERLGIADKCDTPFAKLSGGQKKRLFIALALVNDPELVFLDELTTGLDPQARRAMWDLVRDIRDQGKTIFLTTHYMEEADLLSDRVGIIDEGRISVGGTSEELKGSISDRRTMFIVAENITGEIMEGLQERYSRVEEVNGKLKISDEKLNFKEITDYLHSNGATIHSAALEEPTLEDVFIQITGKELRE